MQALFGTFLVWILKVPRNSQRIMDDSRNNWRKMMRILRGKRGGIGVEGWGDDVIKKSNFYFSLIRVKSGPF